MSESVDLAFQENSEGQRGLERHCVALQVHQKQGATLKEIWDAIGKS